MDVGKVSTLGSVQVQGARADIQRLLEQMREVSNQSELSGVKQSEQTNEAGAFSDLLSQAKSSVDHVNGLQQASSQVKAAYAAGEDVSLSDVVLASQKSSLAFQGLLQVRNKLLEAYKDVMNMPI